MRKESLKARQQRELADLIKQRELHRHALVRLNARIRAIKTGMKAAGRRA